MARELIEKGSKDLEKVSLIFTQLVPAESKRFDSGIPNGYRGWIPGFATEHWMRNLLNKKKNLL